MEEEEQNEILTMHLNWFQSDCATSKKLMGQRQAQQEVLQAHYSTCLRSLQETERSLARLNKVAGGQLLMCRQLWNYFIQRAAMLQSMFFLIIIVK